MSIQPVADKEPSLHETIPTHHEPTLGGEFLATRYMSMLENTLSAERGKAVAALAQMNSISAIEPLCRVLGDRAYVVIRPAAQALIALGERYPTQTLKALQTVLKSRDSEAHLSAMVVAYRITRDPEWLVKMAHREAMRYCPVIDLVMPDVSCVPILLRVKTPPHIHTSPFDYAISRMGPEVMPILIAALEDETTRERAVRLLVMRTPMEAMIQLSRSPDPMLRRCAVRVIAGFESRDREGWFWFGHLSWYEPVLARMLEIADEDIDLETQRYLITVLGNWRSTRAGPALRRFAQSDNLSIRELAVTALGDIQDRYAPPLLRPIVRVERGNIRRRAITALRRIGDRGAVPGIIQRTDDLRHRVRRRSKRWPRSRMLMQLLPSSG